jgi:hypothetical protein
MAYKDPERKKQWEREHREQRNAQRRIQRRGGAVKQNNVPGLAQATTKVQQGATFAAHHNAVAVATTADQSNSGLKVLVGVAVVIIVLMFVTLAGVNENIVSKDPPS